MSGFHKVLNPGNGYAAEPGVYADTSGYTKDAWSTDGTLSVDIVAGMVGWPIQFGFTNTGGAYHPSAMLYDNMVVAATDTATNTTPTASDQRLSQNQLLQQMICLYQSMVKDQVVHQAGVNILK